MLLSVFVIIIQTCIIIYMMREQLAYNKFQLTLMLSNYMAEQVDASENKSQYVNRSRIVIVITPTFLRFTRLADLTRLVDYLVCLTLMLLN
ncbi:unnamed protein product [Gongylonema pulchrum]|uniref:Secreted protein n=1 Tax=Gongylonema pulchrum TaxID=637853 RepID=A0A183DK82_9BILA|nr:unnamed protein product [Gongylonema pulchrum]